ncbi:hypothetical protein SAMN05216350_103451 [Polaromonas sp. YR568]|uniref:hypothetical protein n=1 Tax=Polaromonas sp. YR568 TaxID=1855301 RepID=UPI0008EEEB92|nr:hypothetical protein [Polaromonas sp. YR568]SFU66468.1 hypothetical protein SAMN05216350_103451 [Polaromonas sp. YR568]
MATNAAVPNLPDVSQLDFGPAAQNFDDMGNEEFKRFLEVWFTQGGALTSTISLALKMQNITAGAEAAAWAAEGIAADKQVGRLRRMMDEFRANQSTIKAPTAATVQKVKDLAQIVGNLQAAQLQAQAIAAAVASVFIASNKVFSSAAPPPA